MIKRFTMLEGFSGWDIHPSDDGEYVLYDDYGAIRTQLAEAQAKLQEAERDAARYRWLKDQLQAAYDGNYLEFDDAFTIGCSMVSGFKQYRRVKAELAWGDMRDEPLNLDAAIDAAMEQTK